MGRVIQKYAKAVYKYIETVKSKSVKLKCNRAAGSMQNRFARVRFRHRQKGINSETNRSNRICGKKVSRLDAINGIIHSLTNGVQAHVLVRTLEDTVGSRIRRLEWLLDAINTEVNVLAGGQILGYEREAVIGHSWCDFGRTNYRQSIA